MSRKHITSEDMAEFADAMQDTVLTADILEATARAARAHAYAAARAAGWRAERRDDGSAVWHGPDGATVRTLTGRGYSSMLDSFTN